MKNIQKPLIFAGLAAAAYLVYRNFQGFQKTFTVQLGKIRFNKKATAGNAYLRTVFDVDLVVNNPSNFTGNINAIKLNIIVNDKILGSINQTNKINIPARNQIIYPVQIGVSTLNLFSNIQTAIIALNNKQPISVKIAGTVLTNYGTINIDEIATLGF